MHVKRGINEISNHVKEEVKTYLKKQEETEQ